MVRPVWPVRCPLLLDSSQSRSAASAASGWRDRAKRRLRFVRLRTLRVNYVQSPPATFGLSNPPGKAPALPPVTVYIAADACAIPPRGCMLRVVALAVSRIDFAAFFVVVSAIFAVVTVADAAAIATSIAAAAGRFRSCRPRSVMYAVAAGLDKDVLGRNLSRCSTRVRSRAACAAASSSAALRIITARPMIEFRCVMLGGRFVSCSTAF